MVFQTRTNGVAFANIEHVAFTVFSRAKQKINTRLLKFGTCAHRGIKRAWEHDSFANPVGALDETQTVGVAIDYEYT